MADLVSLTCPSCGGKLEITNDLERFACGYCGIEHIVRRGGGVVSLRPVVEGLKGVQVSANRTAAELAIQRLKSEIGELEREARKIKQLLVENHAAIFESKWAMSRSEIQNLSLDQLEEMYRFFSRDPIAFGNFGNQMRSTLTSG